MIQKFLEVILSVITSILQIFLLPINAIITATLPDLSSKILEVSNNIENLFTSMTWALGFVPVVIIVTLLFILSVEIARHTIFVSTKVISLMFAIIQKIKFW